LISDLLQTILDVTSHLKITTVIIGGLALPAYNVARTTLDIDICIKIESQKQLNLFIETLKEKEISTKQHPKINHDLFTVFGKQSEVEIWLKPCDAFQWDEQMTHKIQHFFKDVYVLAVEDYILTKLARADRSSIDTVDTLNILIANKDIFDWEYFQFRLKWVDLKNDFEEVIKAFELDYSENLRNLSRNILDKFENTGIPFILTKCIELLEYVIAFPVADIQKLTDGLGDKVLPDTFLLPKGTTAREFAGYIHKDLYDSFVCGIDARTSKKLSESYEVKDRDIIKIQSSK